MTWLPFTRADVERNDGRRDPHHSAEEHTDDAWPPFAGLHDEINSVVHAIYGKEASQNRQHPTERRFKSIEAESVETEQQGSQEERRTVEYEGDDGERSAGFDLGCEAPLLITEHPWAEPVERSFPRGDETVSYLGVVAAEVIPYGLLDNSDEVVGWRELNAAAGSSESVCVAYARHPPVPVRRQGWMEEICCIFVGIHVVPFRDLSGEDFYFDTVDCQIPNAW